MATRQNVTVTTPIPVLNRPTTKLTSTATLEPETAKKTMTFEELSQLIEKRGYEAPDIKNGPNNTQTVIRLFG